MRYLFISALLFLATAGAQNTDVNPYQIGEFYFGGSSRSSKIVIRKMVYQGCELFTATNEYPTQAFGVTAITTGRGCK